MSGDNILNVFDDTEKDSSIDLGIDLNFDFRLESPLPVWTPVFSAQPSIITLNNTQVSKILDQIILELDQLKFGDYKAVANYHTVLDKLLMPFPAVTYKGITDADIKSKVDIIWHRSVTRNQGLAKNQKPFFANLNVGIRLLMIEHGFYVDTIDKLGKTILFDIIQLSTNNLLIPTLEMMRTQGTLTAVLASVFNNRILKKPQTVFEYLEAYMDRAILKEGNRSKIINILHFYENFVAYLQTHKIQLGFTPQIQDKIDTLNEMLTKQQTPKQYKRRRMRL